MIRLADYVVKFLEKKKINTVFTVSGGGSIFLCDALYKSKKIKYISHHHEQAASFAAESYSRSKNEVGCCFVTTGPGGTQAPTVPNAFRRFEAACGIGQGDAAPATPAFTR